MERSFKKLLHQHSKCGCLWNQTSKICRQYRHTTRLKHDFRKLWLFVKSKIFCPALTRQVHHFNRILSQAKSDWYTSLIEKNKDKPRNLWQSINRILHRSQSSPLPNFSDCTSLSNRFGTFFQEKITKIREILDTKDCSGEQVKPHYTPPNFPKFTPISEDAARKLISSSPNKSCDLDPCPTSIIKECVDLLAKPLATIINASISQGVYPQYFKRAHVTPLLKKSSLSRQELKNYRPVSNLNCVSKLME